MDVRRIGLALPITLWPVVLWFLKMPDYDNGRHGAPALHSVASPLLMLAWIFSGVAVGLVFPVFRSRLDRFVAIAAILANLWLLVSVIFRGGTPYA